ncbi:MAG TPA: ABC transporter substrate-binding protein [Alphaproteobacteria bacterium]
MKRVLKGAAPLVLALAMSVPAAAAEPLKIGVVLPYAPPFGLYSKSVEITMKMAVEEAGGEVAGRKIELMIEDDENKPPVAIAKAKKLILSDKVDVLIGGLASNLAVPLAPVAIQAKTPYIIVNAGADDLTGAQCSPWVMRISFSNDQITRPSGKWLYDKGLKTAYVLTADYRGGRDIVENFKSAFGAAGGKVVGEGYAPFDTKDFGPYVNQAKAAKPDTIFTFFPGAMAIQFVKQYGQFGLKDQIPLTGPLWTVSPIFSEAQGAAQIGYRGTINYIYTLDTPENKKFVEIYKAKSGGKIPDEVSINGYDAVKFIIEAVKKLNGQTDDKAALAKAITQVSYIAPRGPIRIDPKTNNVVQNIYMVEVKDKGGKPDYVILDTVKDVQDPTNGCKL